MHDELEDGAGPPAEMIAAARELYLKYNGRRHRQIAEEMQALGWPFYRELLYSRKRSGRRVRGWPEMYGWNTVEPAKQTRPRHRRGEFEEWLGERFPEWTWNWRYQRYLYERLDRITSGSSKRLMIFMPPRHGKSETVTVRYTAWRMLRDPALNVILGSYTQRLADRFSRKIKRIVQSAGFSPSIRDKSRTQNSISEWETGGGGGLRSVGVGGGVAGFGAGLIVIDDPVRNRADAESERFRDKCWDWFNDDIYTRLEPEAAIILIQTRWHEDDLAGRLLREQEDGGEKWEAVTLPALAEENDPLGRKPGAALCPARFKPKDLERIGRKLGSYSFSALYQQRPSPAKGGRFKREWFREIVEKAPSGLRWARGYDLALSTKTSADHTASFRCAYDKQGNLYIADGFRGRLEFPDQRRYIVERMQSEPATEHGIESALHGLAVVQDLRREPGLRRYAFREVRVEADKLTRALSWLNLAEAGKVRLVRGAWIDAFLDEVSRFPDGRHDDQIDAISVAVSLLSRSKEKRSFGW